MRVTKSAQGRCLPGKTQEETLASLGRKPLLDGEHAKDHLTAMTRMPDKVGDVHMSTSEQALYTITSDLLAYKLIYFQRLHMLPLL